MSNILLILALPAFLLLLSMTIFLIRRLLGLSLSSSKDEWGKVGELIPAVVIIFLIAATVFWVIGNLYSKFGF